MKKTTMIQLLPMLILIGGILILSGCAKAPKCAPLPAKWAEAKFPFLEGGCINTANDQKIFAVQKMDSFELSGKYLERFKNEGWTIKEVKPGSKLVVFKSGKQFSLNFVTGCGDNCSNFEIKFVALPKKLVDVPSLIGKSPDEVKNIIGLTPKKDTEYDSKGAHYRTDKYEFLDIDDARADASVKFKNGKFNKFDFSLMGLVFDTPEELADHFGIDVRGKSTDKGSMIGYNDFPINGVTVKRISIIQLTGTKGYGGFALYMEE